MKRCVQSLLRIGSWKGQHRLAATREMDQQPFQILLLVFLTMLKARLVQA
jgi:hypothetical protein